MADSRLLSQLKEGQVLLGLCQMYPAAGIVEGMCPGWDFVWIDGQHGEMTYTSIMNSLRAAQLLGIETIVRVPGHDPATLGQYADLAPSAIMVPVVNTPQEAQGIVRALRLPPHGNRSFGGRRVIDLYGMNFHQQHTVAVLAQIETVESLKHVKAIAQTDGVDVLLFGGDDMKISMGLPVDTSSLELPRILEAMEQMAAAARAAGKFAACVAADPKLAQKSVEMGYQLLVGGSDIGFMLSGSRQRLSVLRDATKSRRRS